MESETTVWVGWTTVGTREAAERLARDAVEAGLAACAQVSGPVWSFYRWNGEVAADEEWRVTLKFSGARAETLEAWLRRIHPYKTPQWLACAAGRVDAGYRAWIAESSGAG